MAAGSNYYGDTTVVLRVAAALFVAVALNGELISSNCLCYGDRDNVLNTTCLQHCSQKCLKECQGTIQNEFSEELLQSFSVNLNPSRSSTVSGTIRFKNGTFRTLSPALEVQNCTLLYRQVILNKFGKRQLLGSVWNIYKEILNTEKVNNFQLALRDHSFLYVGRVQCRFSNNLSLTSPEKFLTVSTGIPVPKPNNLYSYFGKRTYGSVEDVNHITLTWDPIDQWPSLPLKYHAQCREVSKYCSKCVNNYNECMKCDAQGAWVRDEVVDWFKWYVVLEPPISLNLKAYSIACAVRAVSLGQSSEWSTPVVEACEKINPAPKLIIAHKQRSNSHISWLILDTSPINLTTATNNDAFQVIWEPIYDKPTGHLLDAECCNLYNKYIPRIIGIEAGDYQSNKPGVKSFCLNWIRGTHHEARTCLDNPHLWCINEVDDTRGTEIEIYRAESGQRIVQVACNPLKDYIAFAEECHAGHSLKCKESHENIRIFILFLTNMTLAAIKIEPDKIIFSSAIAIDWSDTVGSVVFIMKDGQNNFFAFRYNPETFETRNLGLLPALKSLEVIKNFGVDWSNYYWLLQNKDWEPRLQFFSRYNTKQIFRVQNVLQNNYLNEGYSASALNILEKTVTALSTVSVGQITDIVPMDAEMRKILTPDQYFPEIIAVKNLSLSPSVLEAKVSYLYKSPLYSLHPAFALILRYRNYSELGMAPCERSTNCETVQSDMNLGHFSDTVTLSITGLKNIRDYYVEVELKPLRSRIYYDQRKIRGFRFHHHYKDRASVPKSSSLAIWVTAFATSAIICILLLTLLALYFTRPRMNIRLEHIKAKNLELISAEELHISEKVHKVVVATDEEERSFMLDETEANIGRHFDALAEVGRGSSATGESSESQPNSFEAWQLREHLLEHRTSNIYRAVGLPTNRSGSQLITVKVTFTGNEKTSLLNKILILQNPAEFKGPEVYYLETIYPAGGGIASDVYQAVILPNRDKIVAVKIPKKKERLTEKANLQLLHEAIILQNLNHQNIVKAIGISMDTLPYKLILEYKQGGNVTKYFQTRTEIPKTNLLKIPLDIAKACNHLAEKGYLHTDVSAKNVLLDLGRNELVTCAYLSDFGLARDKGDQEAPSVEISDGPLFHSAPEILLSLLPPARRQFLLDSQLSNAVPHHITTKSDVYSFGVFLWEIFTYGRKKPYADFTPARSGKTEQEELLYSILQENLRPAPPSEELEECPPDVYQLMNDCWQIPPEKRPTFPEIIRRLENARNSCFPSQLVSLAACVGGITKTNISPSLNSIVERASESYARDDQHQSPPDPVASVNHGCRNEETPLLPPSFLDVKETFV